MRAPRSHLGLWAIICYLMMGLYHCGAAQNKTCVVQDTRADCSHMSLTEIPPDLPRNLTSLDMSHNRLKNIPPASLAPYPLLVHLNVSYNSLTGLDGSLCRSLPLMRYLNVQHNQIHLFKKEDVSNCTSLMWLNMASNRLKLRGEPFSMLQSLKYLDLSMNNLQSPKLGSQPQLPSLVHLSLAQNDFSSLKKDDFSFLNQSSFLQFLNLSHVSLKKFEPGCFKPISGLHILIMDGSNMGTLVTGKLCSELAGTAIDTLSLRSTSLVTLTSTAFKGLLQTNVTYLDLASNGMGKIENGSFDWLRRIETLVLANNNIKHLTKATFEGLQSLKTLQLTHALVKGHTSATPNIDNYSFQPLRSLETLILQKTAVRELTEHTFTGLTSLKDLDMSWTSYASLKTITNQTLLSLAGSPLKKINLTAAAIVQINPGCFSALKNLTTLILNRNFIKQILTGNEFEGLDQLQYLYMSNNLQRINLTSNSFAHVPNLRVLTLGKSLVATALDWDRSPFSPLSDLNILDLSNNNIANIRESMVEGLVNLKVLNLQHNNLARVWKSSNLGGPVLFLRDALKLTSLRMDSNGLDEIPAKALRGLHDLRELNLADNLLNGLQNSIFDDLTSLRALYLHKNLITTVQPEVFKTPLSNLSLLVMGKNPFDCTCESILWFKTWLNTTNTTVPGVKEQYICNTPLAYFKQSIMKFDALSCKDMTPFQALYILSSTAILTLLVTTLLVRFQGWRIKFYWNILINRTLGFSDANCEEGREFEYDAYVIHAEEDSSWVERRLVPLENKRCKFCLEDRDATPGMSQLESIVDNMRKSRKILFVVTETLLRDPRCRRFTAHHALHQVIEASRDSVVLVFLQDVHDYKLFRSLYLRRGMLRPCCILDWPVHKERVPAFHQKLLIALGMTNQLQE